MDETDPSKQETSQHTKTMLDSQVRAVLTADKGEEATLLSWHCLRQQEKTCNFGSTVASLKINYREMDESLEKSYVVKRNPNLTSAFTIYVTTLFQKEVGFYEKLKPHLMSVMLAIGQPALRTPRCFFTSQEKGYEIIVLEDLKTRGFQRIDSRRGMDVAHASLVLRELARIHAASVLLKRKTKVGSMESQYEFLSKTWWNYRQGADEMFIGNMRGHLDMTASVLQKLGGYDAAAKWVLALKTNILQLVQEQTKSSPPFDVLCHADCTSNNFLFRYNAKKEIIEIMVLDFQMCIHTSLANDLVHLFFCCLEGPVRRANQKAFLSDYFSTFSTVLEAAGEVVPFSFQELLEEYKQKIPYGVIMALLVVPLLTSNEEEVPDIESIVDDTSFLRDRESNFCASLCSNAILRTRFLDIFDDLLSSGVITK